MANFKYFAYINGEAIELFDIRHDGSRFYAPSNFSGFTMPVAGQREIIAQFNLVLTPASRKIEYKNNPSRHECDDRCVYAKGKTMRCECSCGGKNHGKR